MRRLQAKRPLALLAVAALAAGMSACGADDDLSTSIPKTSPDLTIPTGTTAAPPARHANLDDRDDDERPRRAVTPPAAAAPPATPPPAAGEATNGGQAPGTDAQPTTGGAQAGGGEFENFCAQNPGAC